MYIPNSLRGEWHFDGYITSDCGAVADIWNRHNYTSTPEETCGVALRAGTDLDCSTFYKDHAPAALASGDVKEEDVDVALRHLFRVQFRLGLFDPSETQVYTQVGEWVRVGASFFPGPLSTSRTVTHTHGSRKCLFPWQYGLEKLNSADHQALALKAARQGIVLLKNEAQALPLSLSPDDDDEAEDDEVAAVVAVERRLRRRGRSPARRRGRGGLSVAVVGPHGNASEALLGNYFGVPPFIVTPLAGVQQ